MIKFVSNLLSKNFTGPDTATVNGRTVNLQSGPAPVSLGIARGLSNGPAPEQASIGGRNVTLSSGPISNEEAEAAADFDVASQSQSAPKAAPAAKVEPKTQTAETKAPEPAKPAPSPAPIANTSTVFKRLQKDLAELTAPFVTAARELRAQRDDLHKRGLSSMEQAKRRIEQIENALPHLASVEAIEAAALEISKLKGVTPRLCTEASRSVSENALKLSEQAHTVLDRAEALLADYLTEAIEHERAFLASHGLPHEATALSRNVRAAQVTVSRLREQLIPLKTPPTDNDGSIPAAHYHHVARMASTGFPFTYDPAGTISPLIG